MDTRRVAGCHRALIVTAAAPSQTGAMKPHNAAGVIEARHPNGTFRVRFDDGDVRDGVGSSEIRLLPQAADGTIPSPNQSQWTVLRSHQGEKQMRLADTTNNRYMPPVAPPLYLFCGVPT